MPAGTLDNVLVNGDFLRGLWNRVQDPAEAVECPVWRQTFAADRWKIRYAQAEGVPVSQAMSSELPEHSASDASLEIRGATGVTQNVFLGQRIEAAEASRYRRKLIFSAWLWIAGNDSAAPELNLHFGTARQPDIFGDAFNDNVKSELIQRIGNVPLNTWFQVKSEIDARAFGANGLSVEIELPAALLCNPSSRVCVAHVRLIDAMHFGCEMGRLASVESFLANRFFQRHDASSINSFGRALVVNMHELHFQFAFPQMRCFPACTLPQENEHLRIFDLEGFPQEGFAYDVTYRSRGSIMLRATKENHRVRDGYLSFVGSGGAILLDAEL